MVEMLNQVQSEYPDSHQGKRWAPARLGGTAPTLEETQRTQDQKIKKVKTTPHLRVIFGSWPKREST